MRHRRPLLILTFALLGYRNVLAAEDSPKVSVQPSLQSSSDSRYWHPAFDPVTPRPNRLQVLLLGHSISIDYTLHVRGLLSGVADVHRPAANCESTRLGLKELERWLGNAKWDIIHFNWGLHDLKLVKTNGGRPSEKQVDLEDYEKNLRSLVSRLQKTGARLIWASTTPVPEGTSNRISGAEREYNAAANRIMAECGIRVDDLHAFAMPRLREIQMPANVHFTPEGSMQLGRQVATCILETTVRSSQSR